MVICTGGHWQLSSLHSSWLMGTAAKVLPSRQSTCYSDSTWSMQDMGHKFSLWVQLEDEETHLLKDQVGEPVPRTTPGVYFLWHPTARWWTDIVQSAHARSAAVALNSLCEIGIEKTPIHWSIRTWGGRKRQRRADGSELPLFIYPVFSSSNSPAAAQSIPRIAFDSSCLPIWWEGKHQDASNLPPPPLCVGHTLELVHTSSAEIKKKKKQLWHTPTTCEKITSAEEFLKAELISIW